MKNSLRKLACLAVAAQIFAAAPVRGALSADEAANTMFVPRVAIYPGDLISEPMLLEVRVAAGQKQSASNYGVRKADLVGKVARRTLLAGQFIPASALKDQAVVIQGRTYDIFYRAGLLTVRGTAVPLQSGAAGDSVNVRNPDTGMVVKAIVQPSGTLQVTGP